eukprot:CAMPEP_0204614558 /NCGR_PEP_ID=MMETSP0717-20131115/2251_1 /ASSEMBLY_ACC=CAM_ASM_000666 /TAXON_ID=230516 /ORGANISM="Chaetoceros curvisetus" /LENGTH=100 /DNA_ID=CAMNT_0051627255 /DNA_START=95 /DNA_END=394 /DNA_ORIENTATION=-
MSRTDGRKIVTLAFAGIAGAIGLGQIYLPYIADRDKLRGLFEEEDMPAQARRELEMMMKAERKAAEAKAAHIDAKAGAGNETKESGPGSVARGNNAGSMW